MRRDKRPTWWMLYVIGLVLMALRILADVYVAAGSLRTVIESALVIAAFASFGAGLVALGVRDHPSITRPEHCDVEACGARSSKISERRTSRSCERPRPRVIVPVATPKAKVFWSLTVAAARLCGGRRPPAASRRIPGRARGVAPASPVASDAPPAGLIVEEV